MAIFQSSTHEIPQVHRIPQHLAIIMDGNGRWAKSHFLPRAAGHAKGVKTVRQIVKACLTKKIPYLTLFAFSSENWRRPADEVAMLMGLFIKALQNEVKKLKENGVRLRVVGDLSQFEEKIQKLVAQAEKETAQNSALNLTIAANYGGRWDILQAMNRLIKEKSPPPQGFTEDDLAEFLSLSFAPEPDLFIRTGGEERISNFLLWQLAYSEFYFTETLWPEFDETALDLAISSYQKRERRFGRTSEQVQEAQQAQK